MKSFVRFFSSVKLAIFLIIILALASVFGTLIPQDRTSEEYAAHYGKLSTLLIRLEFTKIYHSWWYLFLLGVFALNTLICTLKRFPSKIKNAFAPEFEREPGKISLLKISDKFQHKKNLSETGSLLEKELAKQRFHVRKETQENKTLLLARKKALGPFGSDIVHLGLLTILLGAIVSGIGGKTQYITIPEGGTISIPEAGFSLKLEKFETHLYKDGSIKDWKSTLTVLEGKKPQTSKAIEVNHPLSYKGYMFYQSSYGWDWENSSVELWLKKGENPPNIHKFFLKAGEKITLPERDLEISMLRFIPDFILDENRQASTRSLEPRNPAAFVELTQKNVNVFSGWVFAKFPSFSQTHSSSESPYSIEFKNLKAAQYSGIRMSKDPGVNFIWAGCIFLTIGLFVAFYWPKKVIKAILVGKKQGTEIFAGGMTAKSKESLQKEFSSIMTILRRKK